MKIPTWQRRVAERPREHDVRALAEDMVCGVLHEGLSTHHVVLALRSTKVPQCGDQCVRIEAHFTRESWENFRREIDSLFSHEGER